MPSHPTNAPCCALQMSPISPFVVSYQASGGPTHGREADLGVGDRLDHLVRGDRGLVAERRRGVAAAGVAAGAGCMSGMHAVVDARGEPMRIVP